MSLRLLAAMNNPAETSLALQSHRQTISHRIEGVTMEARLNTLEGKITLAEDLMDELNRTVYRQQQQIDQLQQQIRALHQQFQAATPTENRALQDDVPPHY